jgi:hypothetical protein
LKLVIPYFRELQDLDARMVRLAAFLGIPCETVALANVVDHAKFLEGAVSDQCSCFIVNPRVLNEWVGDKGIAAELVAYLVSRFTHLVVHGLRVDAFNINIVTALSRGRLQSVEIIEGERSAYEVAGDSRDICEAFSGLSFGLANPSNDHVFHTNGSDPAVRQLISIGGRPFMVTVKTEGAEILFVGSGDVADINSEVDNGPLDEYFSRFVPQSMALRYAAGDECWRPAKAQASIIIDDPLLRKRYGFLDFESLLRLAEQYNFHAAIAFIPHNFRRNSSRITRMFQENAARLSICFHGNDHTEAEFASTDRVHLNTLVLTAEDRMDSHQKMTGLPCAQVMVFPQGNFSIEAMEVLRAHNFCAAVNTVPHPTEQPVRLTIGELAQPAVLRYGGFPLFLRRPIRETQSHDIAFDAFFGRPVLIVEHHEIFERPEALIEIAARINSVVPEVQWSSLATVVDKSILTRKAPDGTYYIRAYSGTVQVSNDTVLSRRYLVEWAGCCDGVSIKEVLVDGMDCPFEIDDAGLRISMELAPRSSRTVSLVYRNDQAPVRSIGLRWKLRAFLRRRLSEFRDNYLSRNRGLLTAAKAFQRRFLRV